MTYAEISALMAGIAPVIGEFVDKRVKAAVEPLQNRIAELEARPLLKYCGAWDSDRQYAKGEFVTHSGSLWHCNAATRSRPGDGADWTLAVKRGHDGRDAAR